MGKLKVMRPVMIGRQHGQADRFEEFEITTSTYDVKNPLTKTPRAFYNGIDDTKPVHLAPGETMSGIEIADHVVDHIEKIAKAVGPENELQFTKHVPKAGELGDPARPTGKRAA